MTQSTRAFPTRNMPSTKLFRNPYDWLDGCKFITVSRPSRIDKNNTDVFMMIFPAYLVHSEIYNQKFGSRHTLLSAGFISGEGNTIQCHGRSTSLRGSDPATEEDTKELSLYAETLTRYWDEIQTRQKD